MSEEIFIKSSQMFVNIKTRSRKVISADCLLISLGGNLKKKRENKTDEKTFTQNEKYILYF